MKAVILAAGRGKRMGMLTDEKPKCLNRIKDKYLIQYQIDSLQEAGISDIGIVTGYRAEMLHAYSKYIFYNSYWESTNMVYSLLCAEDWIKNESCIISYSDIFYTKKIVQDLMSSSGDIVIAYDPNWYELWSKRFKNPLEDAETFKFNSEGNLVEIGKKTSSLNDIQGQYMGLLKTSPSVWKNLNKENFRNMDFTTFINLNLNSKFKIITVPNFSPWGEVDSESDLKIYSNS